MKKLALISLIIITAATLAIASSIADLTEIGVGARPLGMAKAFNSIVDDGSAVFMNPAGLADVEEFNAISMSGNLMNEVPYFVLGGSRRTHLGVFGVGYIGASVGGIREAALVGITPEVTGNQANYANNTLILSYANNSRKIPYVNTVDFLTDNEADVGLNLKIVNHGFSGAPSFEGKSATGLDLDLGAIFPIDENQTRSLTIKNIIPGNNIQADEMPVSIIGGIAYRIPDRNLLTEADVELGDQGFAYRIGAEWCPTPVFFLRGGLSQKPDVFSYAVGVGTRYRGFSFDYAFHTYAQLAEFNTHFFSLGYVGE